MDVCHYNFPVFEACHYFSQNCATAITIQLVLEIRHYVRLTPPWAHLQAYRYPTRLSVFAYGRICPHPRPRVDKDPPRPPPLARHLHSPASPPHPQTETLDPAATCPATARRVAAVLEIIHGSPSLVVLRRARLLSVERR